jgi:hypothetical protein
MLAAAEDGDMAFAVVKPKATSTFAFTCLILKNEIL